MFTKGILKIVMQTQILIWHRKFKIEKKELGKQ